jgi:predicted protein tyrosine phosphatase
MKIVVCPLSKVTQMVVTHAPERVVSLLDPGFDFPNLGSVYRGRHLRLRLHDVHVPAVGEVAPAREHVEQLLAFVRAWPRWQPLLIHCRAGIGRSTAAAFIAACVHNPHVDERTIALELRRASPVARPNRVLIDLADIALSRGGRMSRAVDDTGRNLEWPCVDENVPFEMPATYQN